MSDSLQTVEEALPTTGTRIKWWFSDVKRRIRNLMVNKALTVIRWAAKDSGSRQKAEEEFKYLGYEPINTPGLEEDPNKWIQENVLDLLSVFSLQGHSGFSASFCVRYFEKLAMHKPLSPIMCTEDEWGKSSFTHDETYQNKRLSAVFKKGKHGKPYYIDAIVWRNQKGLTYTGTVKDNDGNKISSAQNIKLPFTPKTFYVDVIETEVAKDDYESCVKDNSQLVEVFEYYTREALTI